MPTIARTRSGRHQDLRALRGLDVVAGPKKLSSYLLHNAMLCIVRKLQGDRGAIATQILTWNAGVLESFLAAGPTVQPSTVGFCACAPHPLFAVPCLCPFIGVRTNLHFVLSWFFFSVSNLIICFTWYCFS